MNDDCVLNKNSVCNGSSSHLDPGQINSIRDDSALQQVIDPVYDGDDNDDYNEEQ